MPGEQAKWAQSLARAMVDSELSVDAAARLWQLKRSRVLHLMRSDETSVPPQVEQWLRRYSK
jgi:hypothetical protein